MADRLDYFFRQKVTEAELDLGYALLEQAQFNMAKDLVFTGASLNAVVSEHAPIADLTVDVSAPGIVYDKDGQRIFFASLQNIDMSVDENTVPTAVSSPGNERIISLFVAFDRALSDPRLDGNSNTVFFRRDESFKFIVSQGAEAAIGSALPVPLRSDAILLADTTLIFSQSQILNAGIDISRRESATVLGGAGPASGITYGGGGNWADGIANPSTDVESQLDKLITDLATGDGAGKIAYNGGPAWKDTTPNAAATVDVQLDKIITDLVANAGARRIGTEARVAWINGATNPAGSIFDALSKVIADLNLQNVSDDGASRIGAEGKIGTTFSLALGSVRSQLDTTLTTTNELARERSTQVVTIGDGISTFGQFNGTNEAPFIAAATTLPNGGTIFVKRGTYSFASPIIVGANISIVGEQRDTVNITTAFRLTTATFVCTGPNLFKDFSILGAETNNAIFELSGSDITLQDLKIIGDTDALNSAIVVDTGGRNRILFCDITQTGGPTRNPAIVLAGDNSLVFDSRVEHSFIGSPGDGSDWDVVRIEGEGNGIIQNKVLFASLDSTATEDQRSGIGNRIRSSGTLGTISVRHNHIIANLIQGNDGVAKANTRSVGIRFVTEVTSGGSTADIRFERNVIRDNIIDGNGSRLGFGFQFEYLDTGSNPSVFWRFQRNIVQGNMVDETLGSSMIWEINGGPADKDIIGNSITDNRVDNVIVTDGSFANGANSIDLLGPSELNVDDSLMQQTTV